MFKKRKGGEGGADQNTLYVISDQLQFKQSDKDSQDIRTDKTNSSKDHDFMWFVQLTITNSNVRLMFSLSTCKFRI